MSRDVLRRLYSTFAGGWPGIGLLVMRLVVGSVLLVQYGPEAVEWSAVTHDTHRPRRWRYRDFFSSRGYGRQWLELALP